MRYLFLQTNVVVILQTTTVVFSAATRKQRGFRKLGVTGKHNIFGGRQQDESTGDVNNNNQEELPVLFLQSRKGQGGDDTDIDETVPMLELASSRSKSKSQSKGGKLMGTSKAKRKSKGSYRSGKGYFMPFSTAVPSGYFDLTEITALPSMTTAPTEKLDIPTRQQSGLCAVNSEGGFGAQGGDENLIQYIYQVEAEPGTTKEKFENEILPKIETTTVNFMIPHLFRTVCGYSRKLQVGFSTPEDASPGIYVGVSSMPSDRALDSANCGATFTSPCFVVDGALVTFSKGKSQEDIYKEVALLVQDFFELGNLADIPGVDGMAFQAMAPQFMSPTPTSPLNFEAVIPEPAFLPTSPTIAPLSTEYPTSVPSVVPSTQGLNSAPISVAELPGATESTPPPANESTQEESDGGILAWWRWFLVAIIIVIMLIAVVVIYRCPGKPKKQSNSMELEDEDHRFDNEAEDTQ